MNWKRALIPALVVFPLLVLLASRFGSDPMALPSVLVGKPAPPFTLKTLSGEEVSLESLKGQPVVLNFWSTWCVPCKHEHEILQEAAQQYGSQVKFFGVVYQDEPGAVAQYLRAKRDLYPHLLDPNSEVAIAYGVGGVPESFFIDSEGVVRHKQVGLVTPPLMQEQLSAMLKGSGS